MADENLNMKRVTDEKAAVNMTVEDRDKQQNQSEESELNEQQKDLDVSEQSEPDEQEKINVLENQVVEMKNMYLRKLAELDNFKKRTAREKSQIYESAKIAALEDFLPVYEDLQRTIHALEESSNKDVSQIESGIKLIGNKFQDVLKRNRVESIDQTGVPFDVNLHDALLRQKPDDEKTGSDVVLQVLENGYKLGDRTIRHAKVVVSE